MDWPNGPILLVAGAGRPRKPVIDTRKAQRADTFDQRTMVIVHMCLPRPTPPNPPPSFLNLSQLLATK